MGADLIIQSVPGCGFDDERMGVLRKLADKVQDEEERERLLEAVNWLPAAPQYRDTAFVRFEGMAYPVLMSGGLSWGDEPTDACEHMGVIVECDPIWNLLREWAIEDAKSGD